MKRRPGIDHGRLHPGHVEKVPVQHPRAEVADGAAIRNAEADTTARPLWLRQRIAVVLAERKKPQPTIRMFRYAYKGQQVYWESAPCCDQYSTVYTLKGKIICHPDGGITGNGDGQCASFDKEKTNERLVWQDPR